MVLNYTIIGRRIQEVRRRRKLSQAALAEYIDKSTSFISYIETAKKQPSLKTLISIANVLKVSSDYLLATNIIYKTELKDEFSEVLAGCSTHEKRIIVDTTKALKQALRNERKQ